MPPFLERTNDTITWCTLYLHEGGPCRDVRPCGWHVPPRHAAHVPDEGDAGDLRLGLLRQQHAQHVEHVHDFLVGVLCGVPGAVHNDATAELEHKSLFAWRLQRSLK